MQLHRADQLLVLAAPMPGLEPSDITVVIDGDHVIIDGTYHGSRQDQPDVLVSEWTMGRTIEPPFRTEGLIWMHFYR